VDQHRLAEMASLIPRCELITIPAGHLVHAARPAEFTAAVAGFLREDRASERRAPDDRAFEDRGSPQLPPRKS
jgi:hypothetical protein